MKNEIWLITPKDAIKVGKINLSTRTYGRKITVEKN